MIFAFAVFNIPPAPFFAASLTIVVVETELKIFAGVGLTWYSSRNCQFDVVA